MSLNIPTPVSNDEIRNMISLVDSKQPTHVHFTTHVGLGVCQIHTCEIVLKLCWKNLKITRDNPCCDAARTLIGYGLHDIFLTPAGEYDDEFRERNLKHYEELFEMDLKSIYERGVVRTK